MTRRRKKRYFLRKRAGLWRLTPSNDFADNLGVGFTAKEAMDRAATSLRRRYRSVE